MTFILDPYLIKFTLIFNNPFAAWPWHDPIAIEEHDQKLSADLPAEV